MNLIRELRNSIWEKANIRRKELKCKKAKAYGMYEKPPYQNLRILLVVFIILVSFSAVIPFYSRNGFQPGKSCDDLEDGSKPQLESENVNTLIQSDCLPDYKKEFLTLYILGLVNIDELTIWVLGVDRRLLVLKMMHEKKLLQASDIADRTERSLQNISYAMRELEGQGLIKCLTPGKHTWKKFILTEKGTEVFEKLKKDNLIGEKLEYA